MDTFYYDPTNSLCTATPPLKQNPRLFLGEGAGVPMLPKNEKEKKKRNGKSVSVSLINELQKM